MLTKPVYLDHHSTTCTDPRVVEAMLPYFTTHFGNAASASHRFGWLAADAVDRAREQVARAIGAEPREIVFTSGATEANNLTIKGALAGLRTKGDHVVTSATEHRAVLDPLRRLAREAGWQLTILAPDSHGGVSEEAVAAALTDRTVLVSIMAANNEVGTINPFGAIGQICRSKGILFHSDATQAIGKIPIDVEADGIDLLSLSAHKFHGPKGIGVLYVRRRGARFRLSPLFDGGGHERGMRSGTLPVPLIVGLGEAIEIAHNERTEEAQRVWKLREQLHSNILDQLDGVRLNGHPKNRLPGNLNLSFEGVEGEGLLMALPDLAVSSGSACTSAEPEPSHVLRALGIEDSLARASLRFGLGRFNTLEEIDFAAEAVVDAVHRLRRLQSLTQSNPTSAIPFVGL